MKREASFPAEFASHSIRARRDCRTNLVRFSVGARSPMKAVSKLLEHLF